MKCEDLIRKGKEYYDEEISGICDPTLFFSLSSLRRASLIWYPFREDSRILEAGCGCGALTGLLCEKGASVDAVEKDPDRAEMTLMRYAEQKNLQVIRKDIREFRAEEKYDYIIVIEFLEDYDGDVRELFLKLESLLKEDGTLLLGFRNRYALKYICGMTDEYVKKSGDAADPGIRLHTKQEITDLLMQAGFPESGIRTFYPFPDFGFTQAVYSDEMQPEDGLRDRILTYDPYGEGDAGHAVREWNAYDDVIMEGTLLETSDVFLMECRKCETEKEKQITGAILSADREKEHAFMTRFFGNGTVEKRPVFEEGITALYEQYRNLEELKRRGIGTVEQRIEKSEEKENASIIMPFMKEKPLIRHIRELLHREPGKAVEVFEIIRKDILRSSELSDVCVPALKTDRERPVLQKGMADMIPNNAFLSGDRILYYDQEFTVENCPADYILYRALRYTWLHITEAEQFLPLRTLKEHFGLEDCWDIYTKYEDAFTERNRNRKLFAQIYRWAWERKPYETGLVMGAFDLFHKGHLNLLKRAKTRCRFLRAGVLSDELVFKYKNKYPVMDQSERLDIIRSVKYVDEAFLAEGDYVSKVVEWKRKPYDCYFSGDDHKDNEYWRREKRELEELGAAMEFFPYTESVSSSMLRERPEVLEREKEKKK